MYLITLRNRRHPFLGLFDGADLERDHLPQAPPGDDRTHAGGSYFLNDPFFHAQAAKIATRVLAKTEDPARLDELFRLTFQRSPTVKDRDTATAFLAKYTAALPDVPQADRTKAAWGRALARGSCWRATNSSTWIDVCTLFRAVISHVRPWPVRLLMPGILSELLAADSTDSKLAPKKPHFAGKAKAVIFLFMSGGVSHVDSFDPKPKLTADHGKSDTHDHPETRNRPGYEKLFLKKPNWKFATSREKRYRGQRVVPAGREADRRHLTHSLAAYEPLDSLQRDARIAYRVVLICAPQRRFLD